MSNLLPHFIYHAYRDGNRRGSFSAAAMFLDISGFTVLTETLAQHSHEGAEVLSNILNYIFTPLIHGIYNNCGFVTVFAGDAFTALFPVEPGGSDDIDEAMRYATQAAFLARDFVAANGVIDTEYGKFPLNIKIGVANGDVGWRIHGPDDANEQHTYFFRGSAIERCIRAEGLASSGQIVRMNDSAISDSGTRDTPIKAQPDTIGDDSTPFSVVTETPQRLSEKKLQHTEIITPAIFTKFMLGEIAELIRLGVLGEFREVVSLFISFDPVSDEAILDEFLSVVLRLTSLYGGYFNKLDFGDKGATILIAFGAPVAHENDVFRVAEFLLTLREQAKQMRWRAGVTSGSVYAGFIGGEERKEYTVIGDAVNLSARLAMAADWGDIWISPSLAQIYTRNYQLESLGMRSYKGKSSVLPVTRLVGSLPGHPVANMIPLVGRVSELSVLTGLVAPIFNRTFGGLIYIVGDPGIGKTKLVDDWRGLLGQKHAVTWFHCETDEILRQPLNPFKRFLASYFHQDPYLSSSANRDRFNTRYDALVSDAAPELKEDMVRGRSFLGALIDLHWDGSDYERAEPKLRLDNCIQAFKCLVIAESAVKPVIIQIEDVHWLDDDSRALISVLTRNVDQIPFAILMTSRLKDDRTPYLLAVDEAVPVAIKVLEGLSHDQVQTLAEQLLMGKVSEDLITYLTEKTLGNPFFVEQFVFHMRERGILLRKANKAWSFDPGVVNELPTNIYSVLIARLDRLSVQVKTIVQTASVLGQEFEIRVLSAMLRYHDSTELTQHVADATSATIWSQLNETNYIFRHALLRDAAYDMQLRTRLRELHTLAGESIQRVYSSDLAIHAEQLAYHYQHAELPDHELKFRQLAAQNAMKLYANRAAIPHLSRALELIPVTSIRPYYDLLLLREDVYRLLGDREPQQKDLDLLGTLANQLGEAERIEILLRRANLSKETSDYIAAVTYADQALRRAEMTQDSTRQATAHYQIGYCKAMQSEYAEAKLNLDRALILIQSLHLIELEGLVLRTHGLNAWYNSDYNQADTYFKASVELYRKTENRYEEGLSLVNWGTANFSHDDMNGAYTHWSQARTIFKQIGNLRGEGAVLLNLGTVAMGRGDYGTALTNYQQAYKVATEIAHRMNQAIIMNNLSMVLQVQGNLDEARRMLDNALMLLRATGNKRQQSDSLSTLALLQLRAEEFPAALATSQQALALAQAIVAKSEQARAQQLLGETLRVLGRLSEAREAFKTALDLYREVERPTMMMEPLAGLARVAVAQSDPSASTYVEEIMAHFAKGENLDNADEPLSVFLACYEVLTLNQDARAADMLETGHELLVRQASSNTTPAIRESFLKSTPTHRLLMTNWNKAHSPS